MIENLVFSGAGVKIYTLIGFIKCLDVKDELPVPQWPHEEPVEQPPVKS